MPPRFALEARAVELRSNLRECRCQGARTKLGRFAPLYYLAEGVGLRALASAARVMPSYRRCLYGFAFKGKGSRTLFESPEFRYQPTQNSAGGLLRFFPGGGGGIRTHEGLRLAGFQDRSHKPLDHPSGIFDREKCAIARAQSKRGRAVRRLFARTCVRQIDMFS